MTDTAPGPRVVLRSVALPSEHGGWSFLLEPLLLGLLAAGSADGLLLALAALGAFLLHQPLKIALKDWRKGRRGPRARLAERFALAYGLLAALPMLALLAGRGGFFLLPLLIAAPLAAVQVYYDARNKSRALPAELAGAAALGSSAAAVALLGSWTLPAALTLWLLAAARALPAVLYVRARLRLEHGRPGPHWPSLLAHVLALAVLALLAAAGAAPWLALLALLMLLGRAALGLSRWRRGRRAAVIGMQEVLFGLLTVLLFAAGLRAGW